VKRGFSARVLPFLQGFVLIGGTLVLVAACATYEAPPRTAYCSPYLDNGELAEWASLAIKRGFGQRVVKGRSTYRNYGPLHNRKARRDVNKAIGAIGGWEAVESSSDVRFLSPEELALHLYHNHSDHIRYAEALAATMHIYPDFRVQYYRVTSPGRGHY